MKRTLELSYENTVLQSTMPDVFEVIRHDGDSCVMADMTLDSAQRWLAQHPIGTFARALLREDGTVYELEV